MIQRSLLPLNTNAAMWLHTAAKDVAPVAQSHKFHLQTETEQTHAARRRIQHRVTIISLDEALIAGYLDEGTPKRTGPMSRAQVKYLTNNLNIPRISKMSRAHVVGVGSGAGLIV